MNKFAFFLAIGLPVTAMADEWQPMSTAPRDGTVIEIQNSYGIMPWYDIFQWNDDGTWCQRTCKHVFNWKSVDREGHVLDPKDERYMMWRPYTSSGAYVDPTGGKQNTTSYWMK